MSDKSPPQQRWWNIEGWGLRRKVTAVLAVPVTVAMVLGGLRVENELSNAVHFSSAADQVAAVPDIVDFSTAFATATADAAVGTATPEEMAALGDAFGTIASITENPELDPAVTADLLSRIDLASFIESLCYDYQDTGKPVSILGLVSGTASTKPHALRRILSNFIDNALKFGGTAELSVERREDGVIAITVMDRGPGIPGDQIEAAMQPFFRLEQSRNRETGGSGLGLAIAQQLTAAIGGMMRLYNREGGGLAAELVIH